MEPSQDAWRCEKSDVTAAKNSEASLEQPSPLEVDPSVSPAVKSGKLVPVGMSINPCSRKPNTETHTTNYHETLKATTSLIVLPS